MYEVSLFMKNGIVTVHDIAFKTHMSFREPGKRRYCSKAYVS
ncbi:MAG: hypothetical protein ACLT33_02410 [Lachnospira pectinoschiza]